MISNEKKDASLCALHGVLIKARDMSYKSRNDGELSKLLDYGEYLIGLMAEENDKTTEFEKCIYTIADEFNSAFIRERYDVPNEGET